MGIPDLLLVYRLRRWGGVFRMRIGINNILSGNNSKLTRQQPGVAAFPEHGSSYLSLMSAVDAAMYRAKNEGRDRVVVAGNEKSEE